MDKPVAWMHTLIENNVITHEPTIDLKRHPERWKPLYADPTPCKTCEALARTVMLDQTSHDTRKEWVGLTLEEVMEITGVKPTDSDWNVTIAHKWIRAIEAKLKEKNGG